MFNRRRFSSTFRQFGPVALRLHGRWLFPGGRLPHSVRSIRPGVHALQISRKTDGAESFRNAATGGKPLMAAVCVLAPPHRLPPASGVTKSMPRTSHEPIRIPTRIRLSPENEDDALPPGRGPRNRPCTLRLARSRVRPSPPVVLPTTYRPVGILSPRNPIPVGGRR